MNNIIKQFILFLNNFQRNAISKKKEHMEFPHEPKQMSLIGSYSSYNNTSEDSNLTEIEDSFQYEDDDDIDIDDIMDIRGEGGVTVLELGYSDEYLEPLETVYGGIGEEFGGCVDTNQLNSQDENEENEEEFDIDIYNSYRNNKKKLNDIINKRSVKVNPYDQITGELSEAYLRSKPNTLRCKRITMERERRFRELMDNIPSLDQFIVESFVHTYHGYEIAKKWCVSHPEEPIEFMNESGNVIKFTADIDESDLPHWRLYCSFIPTYMGEIDEINKTKEPPRIEGAFTRREREEREKKNPWYYNPNSLRPEDRICILKTLDKIIIKPYVKLMNSIECIRDE